MENIRNPTIGKKIISNGATGCPVLFSHFNLFFKQSAQSGGLALNTTIPMSLCSHCQRCESEM